MTLKDCVHAIRKLRPSDRDTRVLREYCERLDCALGQMDEHTERLEKQIARITPQAILKLVEVNIVPHCNLNCRSCSHFAPLAEEEYLPVEQAEQDFSRLAELSGGRITCIHIMGGEPLLHPECCDFLALARKHFPLSVLRLVTNGILLPSQPESFWACLSDNWIDLSPTNYPIEIDWNYVRERCIEHHISFSFFNHDDVRRTMTRFSLDMLGEQEARASFCDCEYANNTVVLHDGRMYPCEIIPTVRHFNRYFSADLAVTGDDSIDIHEAGSMGEILAFLAKPVPFCRYCDVKNRLCGIKWETSSECAPPRLIDWANCCRCL